MAQLDKLLFFRHLRSESASYVLHYEGGKRVSGGRGAAFWFLPWSASISELPMDEQDLVVVFAARTADFQALTAQGVVTWRIADPDKLAERVDFSLDLNKGGWVRQPLEPIGSRLTQLAQQIAYAWIGEALLADALRHGVEELRTRILDGLAADPGLAELGIAIASVRIASLRPEAEVERALQTPTRELMQQDADKATFERRAMAVETARNEAERAKIDIYRDLPPHVLAGLAAQQLAAHLPNIEHLTLSPDLIGPALARLAVRE